MADNGLLTLSDYADKLLEEKNYKTINDEVRLELKNELLTQLNDTLVAKVIERLSDSEIKELNNLLDLKPSDTQLQQFIKTKIEDPESFITNVLLAFRKTYLGVEV